MRLELHNVLVRRKNLTDEGEERENVDIGGEKVEEEPCADFFPSGNGIVRLSNRFKPH